MGSATPSHSGVDKHKGNAAGGRPGPAPSRGGRVRGGKARTLAPVHPSRLRMCLMCFKIYPRVSEDHPDRSWMLQMGSLSPLSTTCTSRSLSFWNGRRS